MSPSIHVVGLEYSIPRPSTKPPDYYSTLSGDPNDYPPPSYDEALRSSSSRGLLVSADTAIPEEADPPGNSPVQRTDEQSWLAPPPPPPPPTPACPLVSSTNSFSTSAPDLTSGGSTVVADVNPRPSSTISPAPQGQESPSDAT